MRNWFIFLFVLGLHICCFNFFNFCTYYSELIVAHIFKNSTKKIPSLSQKVLAITSPAEVSTLNFSSLISLVPIKHLRLLSFCFPPL